jgi:hypothetical protein
MESYVHYRLSQLTLLNPNLFGSPLRNHYVKKATRHNMNQSVEDAPLASRTGVPRNCRSLVTFSLT